MPTFADLRALKRFCEDDLVSAPDWREVATRLSDGEDDFEVDGVRFIRDECIDEILTEELASDEYVLGCFQAYALAEATGWPVVLIEAAQKGEAFEEIGVAMSMEQIRELARIYASADGYGHHFNSYDFSEEELHNPYDDELYHVFDARS